MCLYCPRQADQTSRFDRDSPGLERDVPVSRKGTFVTYLCPGLRKAISVGTEDLRLFSFQYFINVIVSERHARSDAAEAVNNCLTLLSILRC